MGSMQVVRQHCTYQYAYGTKLLGADTVSVFSVQVFTPARRGLASPSHCPCHVCPLYRPWGKRGPCSFPSKGLGQAGGSLVLIGREGGGGGGRKLDCKGRKENGDRSALRADFCSSLSSRCEYEPPVRAGHRSHSLPRSHWLLV